MHRPPRYRFSPPTGSLKLTAGDLIPFTVFPMIKRFNCIINLTPENVKCFFLFPSGRCTTDHIPEWGLLAEKSHKHVSTALILASRNRTMTGKPTKTHIATILYTISLYLVVRWLIKKKCGRLAQSTPLSVCFPAADSAIEGYGSIPSTNTAWAIAPPAHITLRPR